MSDKSDFERFWKSQPHLKAYEPMAAAWQAWQAARALEGGEADSPVMEYHNSPSGMHVVWETLPYGKHLLYIHPSASVPDGWKLVPLNPTHEMYVAFKGSDSEELRQYGVDFSRLVKRFGRNYKAMLDATPTPQPADNGGRQGVVVTVCYQEGCSDWEPIYFQKEASDEEIEDSIHEDLYHEIHSNPGFRSYSWKRIKRPNPPVEGAE